MKFERVVSDIKTLAHHTIQSIRPGSELTIIDVNLQRNSLTLFNKSNQRGVRSLNEIRRIWVHLCTNKTAHVETVLEGSGTSRNQPETILANLPYVEWLTIHRKKHLCLVGKPTHPIGTIKQMDPIAAQNIRAALQETSSDEPTIIIVTDQIHSLSSLLEKISGIRPIATTNGVYQLSLAHKSILVVNSASLPQPLPFGVYIPISARTAPQNSRLIHVADKEYHLLNSQGAWFLVHVL